MAYRDRRALIEDLERVRDSKVVTFFTSDRASFPPVPGLPVQLDSGPHALLVKQLRAMGHVPRLDLFLYTRGGATDAVWPLVSLLREYTNHLGIIVPFRAHSGGTLICLGADELVLTEFSELSPIDPTTGNQFNPPDPSNPQSRYGISVEDVISYFGLAETQAGIQDGANRLEVFRELTKSVHPLALGNVHRVYQQIRRLARRLLALHMDEERDVAQIDRITTALSEQFYSHVHAITRSEAIPLLGDWARSATAEESPAILALYDAYDAALELTEPLNVTDFMGTDITKDLAFLGGVVESTVGSAVHQTRMRIMQRPVVPPGMPVQVQPNGLPALEPWVGRSFDWGIAASNWTNNVGGL